MKQVSSKQAKINRQYKKQRDAYLLEHQFCVMQWDENCQGEATQVDHKVGRGVRKDLELDEQYWQACCHYCHHKKTVNPEEAHERGLTLRSWEVA